MQIVQDHLKSQALHDLANRAKSGTFVYLVTWLVLTLSFEIDASHPIFFQFNTIVLIALAALRIAHQFALEQKQRFSVTFLTRWLVVALLACALHWGLMLAWFISSPDLQGVRTHFMVISAAFALGGSCTLSISNHVRLIYPTLMLVPSSLYFVWEGSIESLVFAPLCLVSILYVVVSSKASHADYWNAITNSMVAAERAEELQKLSITDPLTQIHNRMYFEQEFKNEWRRAKRIDAPLSVLMIDLDHFKKVNDTFGHVCGDKCLIEAARVIKDSVLRPSDCIARYGGEEFIALLPNTDPQGAQVIGKRIISSIQNLKIDWEGQQVNLTASVGGASSIPNTKSEEERNVVIRRADSALYDAKDSGRNCYKADLTNSL